MNAISQVDEFRYAAPGFAASACRSALDRVAALASCPAVPALAELARLSDQAVRASRAMQTAEQAAAEGSNDIACEQWNASFVLIDELGYMAGQHVPEMAVAEPALIRNPATPA